MVGMGGLATALGFGGKGVYACVILLLVDERSITHEERETFDDDGGVGLYQYRKSRIQH